MSDNVQGAVCASAIKRAYTTSTEILETLCFFSWIALLLQLHWVDSAGI